MIHEFARVIFKGISFRHYLCLWKTEIFLGCAVSPFDKGGFTRKNFPSPLPSVLKSVAGKPIFDYYYLLPLGEPILSGQMAMLPTSGSWISSEPRRISVVKMLLSRKRKPVHVDSQKERTVMGRSYLYSFVGHLVVIIGVLAASRLSARPVTPPANIYYVKAITSQSIDSLIQRNNAVQPIWGSLPALRLAAKPLALPHVRPKFVKMAAQSIRLDATLAPQPARGSD